MIRDLVFEIGLFLPRNELMCLNNVSSRVNGVIGHVNRYCRSIKYNEILIIHQDLSDFHLSGLYDDKLINNIGNILYKAYRSNDIVLINQILKNKSLNFNINYYLDSALCEAVLDNNLHLINLIIQHGATDFDKALIVACQVGNFPLVKYLIKRGAGCFSFPFHEACFYGHFKVAKYLIKKGAKCVLLFADLCQKNNKKWIKLFINNGATSCICCMRSMEEHLLSLV
jgi:ankyrin repeat protein